MAEGWLKKNPNNRSINEKIVREYTTEMLQGAWKANGDAIKFDFNGNLLDGQHRLTALVLSKTTHELLVVTDLEPEVFDTLDVGIRRSAANTLEVKKVPNFNRVASALMVISMYDRGISSRVRDQVKPTKILGVLDKYPDVVQAIAEIGSTKSILITRSLFDGLYYILRRRDKRMAYEYMIALRDGTGIESLSAWHQLRERLIRNYTAMQKMDEPQIMALVIKGWNYARQGRDTTKLVWTPSKEAFPVVL